MFSMVTLVIDDSGKLSTDAILRADDEFASVVAEEFEHLLGVEPEAGLVEHHSPPSGLHQLIVQRTNFQDG